MLSKKDLLIVSCLRKNARETLTKISKVTHIPVSTIYDKLQQHEATIIWKHTTLIDFSKLGFHARANVIMRVPREKREEFTKHLMTSPYTNSLYKINNGYDFLAELVFKDVKEMEDCLELLEHRFSVTEKQVYFIIEDLKKEGFLTDQSLMETVA